MGALFMVSYVLLWILVVVWVVGLIALYNHFGRMYLRSREGRAEAGPAEGSNLVGTQSRSIDGDLVLLPPPARPTLVLFASTTCSLCATVRHAVPDLVAGDVDLDVVILCQGPVPAVTAWAEEVRGLAAVVADRGGRLAAKYEVDLLPFGVAVGPDGIIRGRSLVNDLIGLQDLAHRAVRPELPIVPSDGEPAAVH